MGSSDRCWFISFLLVPSLVTVVASPRNQVVLENSGYENIVVAISPNVPDYKAETILQNIQFMFRQASAVLYEATKRRAYFASVHILIPDSWSRIEANVSTWETFSTSDVRVDAGNWLYGDMPFTVQSGGCGQPGEYIHLTPGYLLSLRDEYNIANYGDSEKVFVHHWARYRYGVFEENGVQGDEHHPLFFKYPGSNNIQPNMCTDVPPSFTTKDVTTQGPCRVDPSTGVYDENCIYKLQPNFFPDSSLMSLVPQAMKSMAYFCEDDQEHRHVYAAPTKHNAMCDSQSVWSVISKHKDFENSKLSEVKYIDPSFKIARSGGSRFVLLMDTSGSMNNFSRIEKLYESARRWIKFDIPDGSQLGMVQFSTQSVVLSPLIPISGDESRERLIAKLPRRADGWTCIGCGLLKSLDILASGGKGGVILLVTDGEETNRPFIQDVMPQVMESGVRIVSIAFGTEAAAKLEELAEQTSGKSYFISDSDTGQGLNNAFMGSLTYQPAVSSDQIIVLLFKAEYRAVQGGQVSHQFSVDSTVGRNFIFRIDYSNRGHIRSFRLISPDGISYNQLQFDDVAKVAFFKLDEAKVGLWRFTLTFSSSTLESTSVQITAQTRVGVVAPITTECYVPDGLDVLNPTTAPIRVLAKVMQGSNPVIRAKVKAYIGLPHGGVEIVNLDDNGSGADTTGDDGIYSHYFVTANYAGRYTLQCQVWDDGSAYINDGFIANRAVTKSRFRRGVTVANATKTGPFTRQADGGSFKVTTPLPSGDAYPPSQIRDLTMIAVDASNLTFTLRFTAPGDELDSGTVSFYEVRYSSVYRSLTDKQFGVPNENGTYESTLITPNHIVNGSLIPLVSGTKHIVTLALRREETRPQVYYVAIQGVDRAGRKGTASNVIAVDFTSSQVDVQGLSTKAIIGVGIGVLLLVLLIFAVGFLFYRRQHLSYNNVNKTDNAAERQSL